MTKTIIIATCTCGEPVHVPIKKLAQVLVSERKQLPTKEHMTRISKLGVEARKRKQV